MAVMIRYRRSSRCVGIRGPWASSLAPLGGQVAVARRPRSIPASPAPDGGGVQDRAAAQLEGVDRRAGPAVPERPPGHLDRVGRRPPGYAQGVLVGVLQQHVPCVLAQSEPARWSTARSTSPRAASPLIR